MPDVRDGQPGPIPEQWREVDTCAVSDALDQFGLTGVVAGVIPLAGPARIVGRAVTVELGPVGKSAPSRHLATAAIEIAAPGDVIVIAHRGRTDCSGWGGNLSLAAHLAGLAAVVVDGACRDVAEAAALGFSVFARAATPRTARGRVCEHSHQQPVIFGDVVVRPGDLVIADTCGVVIVDQEHEESIMTAALGILQREAAMTAAIRSGIPISTVMGPSYERMIEQSRET